MAVTFLDEITAKKVLRQVEFYFSDSNLPSDKFLKQTVDESADGLVSLALICSFKKMRTHLGLGEMKIEEVPEETVLAVSKALKNSELLKISEDGKRVGRSTELSKEAQEEVDSRTVAVSPLPYDVRIEDVESFFAQHGKVNSVRLPRLIGDKRHFCGTALVEFSDGDNAKKVLTTSMVYAGAELEMQPKKDFDAERDEKWKFFEKIQADKDGSNGSYQMGLIIAFKLKSIQPKESTKQDGKEVVEKVPETAVNVNEESENKTSVDVDNSDEKSTEDAEMKNGEKVNEESKEKASDAGSEQNETVSIDDKDIILREDLKSLLGKFGTVKYVDFRMGEESGYIRFEDPQAAVKARAVAVLNDVGGFIVKNHIVTLEPLSGNAEKEYWSLLRGNQKDKRKDNRGRVGGRGNRGGRGFDGKRRRQDYNGATNKAQKVVASDD